MNSNIQVEAEFNYDILLQEGITSTQSNKNNSFVEENLSFVPSGTSYTSTIRKTVINILKDEESTSNSSAIKTERSSPLLNCSVISNQNYQQIRSSASPITPAQSPTNFYLPTTSLVQSEDRSMATRPAREDQKVTHQNDNRNCVSNKATNEPWMAYGNQSSTNHRPNSSTRRGSLQLWQFLVALLDDPSNSSCIVWTGRGTEFKLVEPEEVARRWGQQKNRPAMNYDKLSRSLRYYYEKGIMQKVAGFRIVANWSILNLEPPAWKSWSLHDFFVAQKRYFFYTNTIGERYVYKFMFEPDVLFGMASHQPPDIFNAEYLEKFREDPWPDCASSYTSEVVTTLCNGVNFSRYFGCREEQSPAMKASSGHQLLVYGKYYHEKSTANSFEFATPYCNCANCSQASKFTSSQTYVQSYDHFDARKCNENRFLHKEKYS